MRWSATLLALCLATTAWAATSRTSPVTTNNDDGCDIAIQPAATLLLPYFEVDITSPQTPAVQTLFTIQNVSPVPQIANVTLWTDWGFPALSFPLFLTGYDVQGINLYDIFARASVAPGVTPCAGHLAAISETLLRDLQSIFTIGRGSGAGIGCTAQVGGPHSHAIGYATIDVVSTCSPKNPASSDYFAGTALFDNVLTGDYQQLLPRGDKSYAQGGPLVHIRAIPEGGAAGAMTATNLPYTFYDRYTTALPQRSADRRQPLPSTFAARFIQGGSGNFNTNFKVWREGVDAGTCSSAASQNYTIAVAEIVRFDEHENATLVSRPIIEGPEGVTTSVTSSLSSASGSFPAPSASRDVGGWIYLDLNNPHSGALRPSQNWVITSMLANPTFATEATAVALGNGCSPAPAVNAQVGPAPNPTP